MENWDIVIAGGGHNGLVCGAMLARAGLRVLVAERNPWVGGAVTTREVTLPGFKHDMGAGSLVWLHANPWINDLEAELEEHYGLKYLWAENEITGHPFWDDTNLMLYFDVERTVESIARFSEKDAQRYREIYEGWVDIRDGFIHQFFSPPVPPSLLPSAMEQSEEGLNMLRNYHLSPRAFVLENFEDPRVRSFILGWALAPNVWPDQEGVGNLFYIMIPAIHTYGECVPEGGIGELPKALARYVEAHDGKVMVNSPVVKFIVEDGEAKGIELADGKRIMANKAVITSIDPKHTFLEMIEAGILDDKFLNKVRNYKFGRISLFRVHYAINEPPKFRAGEETTKAAFWRMFGKVEDMDRMYAEIAMGIPPSNPGLWAGCWTLKDPTRAPEGKHNLLVDTFVPCHLSGGKNWDDIKEEYAQVLLEKFREYTTNMTDDNILAYYIDTPPGLERGNPCLVDGTTMGGAMIMAQQGYLRPFPGWSQYKTPVEKLYMAGPFCHPGGGVTCTGAITANVILEDLGLKK
jgi:phytoene dehydrogenase-like protein